MELTLELGGWCPVYFPDVQYLSDLLRRQLLFVLTSDAGTAPSPADGRMLPSWPDRQVAVISAPRAAPGAGTLLMTR